MGLTPDLDANREEKISCLHLGSNSEQRVAVLATLSLFHVHISNTQLFMSMNELKENLKNARVANTVLFQSNVLLFTQLCSVYTTP